VPTQYYAHVDVKSHHVRFHTMMPECKRALYDYCERLIDYDQGYDPRTHSYYKIPKRVFAASPHDRRELRFHINQYKDILTHLNVKGIKTEQLLIEHFTPVEGDDVTSFVIDDDIQPYEYQLPVIDHFLTPGVSKITNAPTGSGKMQPLDSLIKIPGGWKQMGDIQVGDKITAPDGHDTFVNGVFPQGKMQIYKVTFADGRSTEVGGEHLWKMFIANYHDADKRWRIGDTFEMMRELKRSQPRVYIPLIQPEQGEYKELPIHPWTLGAMLGDGCFTTTPPTFTTTYVDIFHKLSTLLPEHVTLSCGANGRTIGFGNSHVFRDYFKHLGLWGCRSADKFIPKMYLEASVEQRYALLQGLMDTDGGIDVNSSMDYSSVSEQLAKDVQYLVRSLGGIAKLSKRQTHYTYKGERKPGQPSFRVNIRHPKPSSLFTVPHKLERANDNSQYAKGLKLRVVNVEPSRMADAQCISVTHKDHLYVTDDFVVTHNTMMSLYSTWMIKKRTILVVPAKYITEGKWIGDITKTLNVPREKLCVVKGSKAMRALIDLGLADALEYDFIIISATTMYNFYKAYEEGKLEEEGYNCDPDELYTVTKTGLRVIDEVHENFHLNFTQDLYGHVAKTIYMSATLVSDNAFINSMLEVAYPVGERITPDYDGKYIACTALTYRCNKVELLSHKRRKMYSQMLFEASILKKKFRSEAYAEMIYDIVLNEYISIREPGQKMMIFADTIEMCTYLTSFIKPRLTDLTVNRFVGEDPDEYLYESDVIITTPKSAGTAVDIKGLKVTLLTSAIGSRQLNAQILGRLRKLRGFEDNVPRFFYLVCEDIDSHVKYHERKLATFSDKVKTHRTLQTAYVL